MSRGVEPVRTVVRNLWSGPMVSSAARVVTSFIVEAGTTMSAPWRYTGSPSKSWSTATATCGPSSLLASSRATACRTFAGSASGAGASSATSGADAGDGRLSPGGGATSAGSVTGDGWSQPSRRVPRSNW